VAASRGFKTGINLGGPENINPALREGEAKSDSVRARAVEPHALQAVQPIANNLTEFSRQKLYLRRSKQKMNAFV
jgi:hypothetical protein